MESSRQFVRARAENRCEYCRLHQHSTGLTFHLEHIVPKKHGGSDAVDNLALACHRCNLCKGANLTGIDPVSGQVVALFNPRRDFWPDHFVIDGAQIRGITAVGRATVQVLAINDPRRVELREHLVKQGSWP